MTSSLYLDRLSSAQSAFASGDLEAALQHAADVFRTLATPPFPLPLPGGLLEFDLLLDAVGARVARDAVETAWTQERRGDWVLATCLYETGGHTPVVRDLADALPRGLSGVVLTLVAHEADQLTAGAIARTGLASGAVTCLPAGSLIETTRNVVRFFAGRPPARLFLLHHPEDVAAAAAAAALAAAGTEIWLIHHADLVPCAGLLLSGIRVVDLTPRASAFTRHVLGLSSIFLPLTCPDPGAPPERGPRRRGLTTALSGSLFKASQDSVYGYAEVLSALLAGGGTHVHIGPLRDDHHRALLTALGRNGIAASRFVHRPLAPTLVDALREEGIDLLINTWPFGGARTTVEAAAAGVPVVWHSAHASQDLVRLQMAWAAAPVWRRPRDLSAIAAAVTPAWLLTQSTEARRHYETRHHPAVWRQFFAAPDSSPGLPLPPEYSGALFLPALWHDLVAGASEIDDRRVGELGARMGHAEDRLAHAEAAAQASQDLRAAVSAVEERLQRMEQRVRDTRFPWPARAMLQWWRRRRS